MIESMSRWESNSLGYEVVVSTPSVINGVEYYSLAYEDLSSEILTEPEIRDMFTFVGNRGD